MSRADVAQRCFPGSILLFSVARSVICGVAGRCRRAEGRAASMAFDVHPEDVGMVDEPVDGSDGHGLVREDGVPSAERLVGGDRDGSPFAAGRNQLEEHARSGLILPDMGEVAEDRQVEAVALRDLLGECQGLPCDLQALDEVGRSGAEDTDPCLTSSSPDPAAA